MKLTKRIKLTRGRAQPCARWVPLGYYRNRQQLLRAARIGIIDNLTLYCTPRI